MHPIDVALPHGVTLSCRSTSPPRSGSTALPRVLLLHGFPEGAFVWDEVADRFEAEATLWAPNLRGYERSSAPTLVTEYRAKFLLQDLEALIHACGSPMDLVVGHDWGGALAWGLASRRPDLMRRLLILNAPHPAMFLRELRDNPAQQVASAYMTFLCRPDAAALLAADDFARLWSFFAEAGATGGWLGEGDRRRYRDVWRHGLDGGLNYYRASPLRPPLDADSPIHLLELGAADTVVRVPTTVLWGERDRALLPSLLEGLDAYVSDLEIVRVSEASHWIVHEQPALVVATIRSCLDRVARGGR